MKHLRTIDIARQAKIHVNTVRFYERIKLISEVPRDKNNYRVYSERHLCQVLVLRFLFLNEWPGKAVRDASYQIIEAMKSWNIKLALQKSHDYLDIIKQEIDRATQAVNLIKTWSDCETKSKSEKTCDFRQTAALIGTTKETIRNWERNSLIYIPRNGKKQTRYFTDVELARLKVIYLLRQARFSVAAIHRALRLLDSGKKKEAVKHIESPDVASVITSGDHVLEVLSFTRSKASELLDFLKSIRTSFPNQK